MFLYIRLGFILSLPVLCAAAALSWQDSPSTPPGTGKIYLDVVVTPKSGPPIGGLQRQDFTVLDNKVPVTVDSFQALGGSRAPIEVILVVDDVNTGIEQVAYERSEMDKFLRVDGGHLSHPTALAFLTDSGIKLQDEFSDDGNALSAELDKYSIGLHSIVRSGGVYSAIERFQISLDSLSQLRPASLPVRDARSYSGFLRAGRCFLAPASRNRRTQSNSSRSSTRSSLCQLCCGRAASLSTVSIL